MQRSAGDWLGVVLNRVEQTVSFTKKGYDLGVAFEGVTEERLYPSIGFRTPDEEVGAAAPWGWQGLAGWDARWRWLPGAERLRLCTHPPIGSQNGRGTGGCCGQRQRGRTQFLSMLLLLRPVMAVLPYHAVLSPPSFIAGPPACQTCLSGWSRTMPCLFFLLSAHGMLLS